MRSLMFAFWMAVISVAPAMAAVDIGFHLGVYPRLTAVPGLPVYYAPGLAQNYFFYDGLYWVLEGDTWYDSTWYDGPWDAVDPLDVPSFILQVPIIYYRLPPPWFGGWGRNGPPHWHEHWGPNWHQHRPGWNDHHPGHHVGAAPLPNYQRRFTGDRYPRPDQQGALHGQNYHYQPREPMVQQHYSQHGIGQGGGGRGAGGGGGGGGDHGGGRGH